MEEFEYIVFEVNGRVLGQFDELRDANIFIRAYFEEYDSETMCLCLERVEKERNKKK